MYVDDILLINQGKSYIDEWKAKLMQHYDMKNLGEAQKILGVIIIRDKAKKLIFLSQTDYSEKVLDMFSMNDVNSSYCAFRRTF